MGRQALTLRAPEPLNASHVLLEFHSANLSLNRWLKERAVFNEREGASRTFVICDRDTQDVIGYYCLAQGAIGHNAVSAKFKRNMPNPIPVTVLGRLAVDARFAGQGLGSALMKDAVLRCKAAAKIAGARGIFVQALDEEAAGFYVKFGFVRSPVNGLWLVMGLVL
jgi:GNAT superfamily N-acetyltransferase